MKPNLHPSVHGCIPGHSVADVGWDAQADLEEAVMGNLQKVLASIDYHIFFDAFEFRWTREFMIHVGLPPSLANLTFSLHSNLRRTIKIGAALGQPFQRYGTRRHYHAAASYPVGIRTI